MMEVLASILNVTNKKERRHVLRRFGRIRGSIADLLVRFYPPEVLHSVASDWADEGRFKEALKVFNVAERKYSARSGPASPNAVGMRAGRAWCLVMLGKPVEGAELYSDALIAKRQSGDDQSPSAMELAERLDEARSIAGLPRIV